MRDVDQKFVFAIQKFVFAIKCRARVKSCRRIGHWGAADSPEPGYPSKLGLGVRAVGDGLFANSSPRERVVLSHCRRLVAGTGPPSLRAGPRDHDHRPALRLGGSEARRLGTLADRADRGGASRPLPPLRALGLPQPARRGALALPGDACSLCRSSAGCAGEGAPRRRLRTHSWADCHSAPRVAEKPCTRMELFRRRATLVWRGFHRKRPPRANGSAASISRR
jgi:hypothetical protein